MGHETRAASLAAEAYVYGAPLVRGLETVGLLTQDGLGSLPATAFNHFAHADPATGWPGDEGTLCSLAHLDLSEGPLVLQVPPSGPRYAVYQFVDAWTNDFAYAGLRAGGADGGSWLLAPPGWEGQVPGSVREVIEAPTAVATLVVRYGCALADAEDVAAVRELRGGLALHPLTAPGLGRGGLPGGDPLAEPALRFWERLRVWAGDFPPSGADRAYQERFQSLGLLEEGATPYAEPAAELRWALEEGEAAGRAQVEAAAWRWSRDGGSVAGGGAPAEDDGAPAGGVAAGGDPPKAGGCSGGWEGAAHLFDFNLDHLGPGTLDAELWRVGDRSEAYLRRAVAARVGLWGPHGYEATTTQTYRDAAGERLDGAYAYTLRLPPPPPAYGWALSAHEVPRSPGPEPRAVSDRTPGLVREPDGAVFLRLAARPPRAAAANWVPVPAGPFRAVLRLYVPEAGYRVPGLVREEPE
ncbi:DUF1254 domain-containing protein [Streptomyces sp. CLI2509]|uniref:DUF1254 domain-containing protein n=2 Tax=unclassified Streptomyces TaxID=2593676 RepID=UPI000BACC3B6|nr:DUF1254 domain-containing protein [Streptomyces sp. CLI2509]ASY35309.1 hypothetical protein CAC01_23695 [Streptomyces sp. CLI2509]